MTKRLYEARRDTEKLMPHFSNHMMAMTAENLHEKSSIALELAHRDAVIADCMRTIDMLMPGIGAVTNLDFKLLNDTLISAGATISIEDPRKRRRS